MKVQKFPDNCKKVKVRIVGTRPLLLNSPQSLEQKDNTKKRTVQPSKETQAESCLYKDSDGNVVFPSLNVLSSMRESGVDYLVPGKGKKTYKHFIYSGVQISPYEIPIISEKPYSIDLRSVVIGKARVVRARPKYDKWALEFEIENLNPSVLTFENIREILENAGLFKGLGDFRPLFGLFEVESMIPIE